MTMHQTREQWLDARRRGIGGSDIAAIVGLSSWSTPLDIWLDKRGEGNPDDSETQFTYWGTVLEDVVAKEYAIRTGSKIQRVNQMMFHPEHSFAMANIDRAIVNPQIAGHVRWKDGRLTTDKILECKTSNAFTAKVWGEAETDQVPDYYLAQCMWYLGITGAETADLAVLIGGNDYRTYTIARDQDLIDSLLEEGAKFWDLVTSGQAPDPVNVSDASRLWPQHIASKKVIVDVEIATNVARLAELAELRKQISEEEDSLKLSIMSTLEDAESVILTHGGENLATWKTQSTTRIDTTLLKKELPDIAAQYSNTTMSRVFRLAKAGKELIK